MLAAALGGAVKTKTICIGLALFAGVLGYSETARADEPCSDLALLGELCEVLGQLFSDRSEPPAPPPAPEPPAPTPTEPPPSDSNDAPITPALTGKTAPSTALPSHETSSSSDSSESELSGPPVQDPVAVNNGESPATADLGEVGGGGGCTLANRVSTSPADAAALAALGLVVACVARRRRGDAS